MPTFTVTRDYTAGQLVFEEGNTVEVDDDVAAWVNRDSPGTLEPAEHVCETCGYIAKSAAGLSTHRRIHEAS